MSADCNQLSASCTCRCSDPVGPAAVWSLPSALNPGSRVARFEKNPPFRLWLHWHYGRLLTVGDRANRIWFPWGTQVSTGTDFTAGLKATDEDEVFIYAAWCRGDYSPHGSWSVPLLLEGARGRLVSRSAAASSSRPHPEGWRLAWHPCPSPREWIIAFSELCDADTAAAPVKTPATEARARTETHPARLRAPLYSLWSFGVWSQDGGNPAKAAERRVRAQTQRRPRRLRVRLRWVRVLIYLLLSGARATEAQQALLLCQRRPALIWSIFIFFFYISNTKCRLILNLTRLKYSSLKQFNLNCARAGSEMRNSLWSVYFFTYYNTMYGYSWILVLINMLSIILVCLLKWNNVIHLFVIQYLCLLCRFFVILWLCRICRTGRKRLAAVWNSADSLVHPKD